MVHTAATNQALSQAQHRLWLAARVEPDSFEFTVPWAVRVRGALDADALSAAWTAVLTRHAELRLRIVESAGVPGRALWPVESMPARVREIAADELDAVLHAAATRVFDVGAAPLAELEVLRLADDDHVVLLTAHHIVTDGRTVRLVTGDLFAHYAGTAEAAQAPSYAEYAAWEATSPRPAAEKVEAWLEELRVPVADRPLGLGSARPTDGKRGAEVRVPVDAELWRRVLDTARELRTTPQVIGMAALGITLRRYTGAREVVLGSTMDTRTAAFADTAGMFINPTPVRLSVEDDSTAADHLAAAHRALLRAFTFRHVPFDEVVRGLGAASTGGRSPVFQVLFNYAAHQSALSVPGLELTPVRFPTEVSKYDLTVWLRAGEDTAEFGSIYRADQYTEAQVEQLTTHLRTVLAGLVSPAGPIGELPMLDDDTVAELLALGDGGPVAAGADVTVVEKAAEADPERPAVVHAGETLDHRSLQAWAGSVARRLNEFGVGGGATVGILTERSPAMVAAALGVLRAGAAYLPLDPAVPDERIAAVLADAGVSHVLTTEETVHRISRSLVTLRVDQARDLPTQDHSAPVSASDPAYLIYTSGTTGEPKGVVVEHGQLAASTAARRAAYPGTPVFLHVSPLAFDSSAAGLWGTLTSGGTLVIAGLDDVRDPKRLLALIEEHGVTDLLCVPALYDLVLSCAGDGSALRTLRRVVVAGEALPEPLLARHFAVAPDAQLVNEYGPTETTVWATHRVYDAPAPVTIGRPIPGTRLYVVDDRGELAPPGAVGELRIGGAGVARGYRGRPEDPAFGADRFTAGRTYRTGDRVRWTPAGELEFLGRADQQVKIRGHRVELGAVEAALSELDGVRGAVVRPDPTGTHLLGFVVAAAGFDATAARRRLAARLPEPMVPKALRVLDAFPLTPNGKVDHDALLVEDEPVGSPKAAAPADDVVGLVSAAWCAVLGVTEVPVDVNFFDVGGHSLLVPLLQVEITARTGVELSIPDLFTEASVLAQVELVSGVAAVPASADDVAGLVSAAWCAVLGVTEVPVDVNFFDVGGHSLLVPLLQVEITTRTGVEVSIADLFTEATVTSQIELVRGAAAVPATTDDVVGQVSAAWCAVLGVTEVPLEENFFDVGGHSLLVPLLQVEITTRTGVEVSIADLFTAATVTSQADLVRGTGPAPQDAGGDRRSRLAARARRGTEVTR
ncbi:non-ribosomal peptide synthetase [Lentzea sp. CA-135723]|uniref:non-ribosomal peptide synthetase n=1 Tax=Lentzea sp. CA-135723 TaxID=3239950 RepID=UPI003D8D30F5